MRSLLLIALALLAYSTALKCYEGSVRKENGVVSAEDSRPKVNKVCPRSSRVCVWIFVPETSTQFEATEWRCGNPPYSENSDGDEARCDSEVLPAEDGYPAIPRDVCYCKHDLCNESQATARESVRRAAASTTTLSLLIAALAAVNGAWV